MNDPTIEAVKTAYVAGVRDRRDGFTALERADAAMQFGGSVTGQNDLYGAYLAGYYSVDAGL